MSHYNITSNDVFQERVYTYFIQSTDRTTGTANNCTFTINWTNFLPESHNEYNVFFKCETQSNYFLDFSSSAFAVNANFGSRSFTYDSTTNCPSYKIGFIKKDASQTSASTNIMYANYLENPPISIGRPQGNSLSVWFINPSTNTYAVNTNSSGVSQSTLCEWQMELQFIPIKTSLIENKRFQDT